MFYKIMCAVLLAFLFVEVMFSPAKSYSINPRLAQGPAVSSEMSLKDLAAMSFLSQAVFKGEPQYDHVVVKRAWALADEFINERTKH